MTAKTQLFLVPLQHLVLALTLSHCGQIITRGRYITWRYKLPPFEQNISSINVNYAMVPITSRGARVVNHCIFYFFFIFGTQSQSISFLVIIRKTHTYTRLSTIHLICCVYKHNFIFPPGNTSWTATGREQR